VQRFWDDVCLRSAGPYNRRIPYGKVAQIQKTFDHQRAFIHGRATPTYETRIFRTSKSRRVLASYVDAVESLLRFSLEPGTADLLEADGPPMTPEAYAALKREAAPTLVPFTVPDGSRTVYVDYEWGDQFDPSEVIRDSHSGLILPNQQYLEMAGRRMLTLAEREMIEAMEHDKGARGWADGTVPLRSYLQYITDNEKAFPFLTARLGYDKFASYFGKAPARPTYPHREEKHLEFQPGCIVRLENGRGQLFCIEHTTSGGGEAVKTVTLSNLESGEPAAAQPINVLIHACKGALSPCGEV
jgi:hypothetical protein